jgi:hypothetical protein
VKNCKFKKRKAFFSVEKNQKTFSGAVADGAGGTYTVICKSLLLLFFRKEGLPSGSFKNHISH